MAGMRTRHSRRRTRTALVALTALTVVGAAALAGCGKDAEAASSAPDSQSTSKGATLKAHWPLTGLPQKSGTPSHPPVVVKIDNTESSQPQIGLAKADLITEELVEGGLTRLAVFFDTFVPDLVGPVRSMRASDIGIVKPVHGVVVTSGAAVPTIKLLNKAGVVFRSNDGGASGFYRDSARTAPYNLMSRLGVLVTSLKKPAATIAPYLPWGKESDFTGTKPAGSITARFGAGHSTQWAYRNGTYTNTNSNTDPSRQFHPDTVVVVRVNTKDAGYTDPAGNFVPESVTTGGGAAMVFHDGKALKATWSKTGPAKNWAFKDASGKAVQIPAGHTWIEVLPRDDRGGSLTFGR